MSKHVGFPDQPQSKGWVRKLIIVGASIGIIALFIILALVIIAANKKPQEKRRPFRPLAVMADYAYQDTIQLEVFAQGEARPRTEIDLVPQISGKIVYVSPNFIEGGIFKKGETLIRIEDADYKVAVVRAEASVAQAEQALAREIAEGEVARKDYEELGRGEPSPLALRLPQRQQAEAALQAANAELDSAKLQLTRTAVRAPFSGRVRSKNSGLGQFISPGARLGRIFSTDIVEVRLPLTDDDLSKLDIPIAYVAEKREAAPSVKLSAKIAGKTRNWDGRIMRTDSTYDPQTRALSAIVEVYDPYGEGVSETGYPLAPGLFVDAFISGRTYENIIVLPRDGLRPQDEVYVVDDKGKSEIRPVSVLSTTPEKAYLFDGVKPGELVVLSPMERSRTANTLKVLNVKDPSEVLVDPPKPEWMTKQEDGEGDDEKKKGKRDKDKDPDKTAETGGSAATERSE